MNSPTASPFLKSTLTRWTSRQTLLRKELDQAIDHVTEKKMYLDDLMTQILRHRREDLTHLSIARQDVEGPRTEKLRRVEVWTLASQSLEDRFSRVEGWLESTQWFHRALALAEKMKTQLLKKANRFEKQHFKHQEALESWLGRLSLKEIELQQIKHLEAASDIYIANTRKAPLVEFAVRERQEETRLNQDLRRLRDAVNLILKRLEDVSDWATKRADFHPATFESYKMDIQEAARSCRERFAALRNRIMNNALLFEEGRKKLRWIYDNVQQMRTLPFPEQTKKSWLNRLLNYEIE